MSLLRDPFFDELKCCQAGDEDEDRGGDIGFGFSEFDFQTEDLGFGGFSIGTGDENDDQFGPNQAARNSFFAAIGRTPSAPAPPGGPTSPGSPGGIGSLGPTPAGPEGTGGEFTMDEFTTPTITESLLSLGFNKLFKGIPDIVSRGFTGRGFAGNLALGRATGVEAPDIDEAGFGAGDDDVVDDILKRDMAIRKGQRVQSTESTTSLLTGNKEAEERRRRPVTRRSTILTGPLGVSGGNTFRPKLLGG